MLDAFQLELVSREGPAGEAQAEACEWLQWLLENETAFAGLSENEAADRLIRLHRVLDYHVWAPPEKELDVGALERLLSHDAANVLLERIRARQKAFRTLLASKGLERVQASTGASFSAGVIEWSDLPAESTRDPALHHRVFCLDPGEGGYRAQGRVLMPSRARRYVFEQGADSGNRAAVGANSSLEGISPRE